jgi:hypothetical protein
MDAGGIESLCFRAVWTAVDTFGHGLEIYGSGGSRRCARTALINSEDNHRRGSGEAIVRAPAAKGCETTRNGERQ